MPGPSNQVCYFCMTCGHSVTHAIKASKEQRASIATKEEINTIREEFGKRLIEARVALVNRFQSAYEQYIDSAVWREKANHVLEHDPFCAICGAQAEHVHHKSYERVDLKGGEPQSDLVPLCERCHRAVHQLNPWEAACRSGNRDPFQTIARSLGKLGYE